jgi:hypothetical protein
MNSLTKHFPAWLVASATVAVGVLAGPASAGAAESANIVYVTHAGRAACDAAVGTDPCHVAVMNTDGVGRVITSGPGNDVDPAWSPDGTRIAFARSLGGHYDVWVMNADGSGQTQLTNGPRDERSPAWSPDGTRIAYRGYPNATGGTAIFTMDRLGGGQGAVPHTNGGDQPAWSPDGQRIAYTATATSDPNDDRIWAIGAAGDNPVQLTNTPGASDRYPAWRPGAAEIAFRRLDSATPGRELWQITCGDPQCATGGTVSDLTDRLGAGRAASWSPDATSIAFVSFRDADRDGEIWIGSTTGTIPTRQLTFNTWMDDQPRWGNVPAQASPVPVSSGGTTGGTADGRAVQIASAGTSITVGGGIVNGREALSLTLLVPKQKLGRHRTVKAYARCNRRCTVTGSATAKMTPRSKIMRLGLSKVRRTLKANARSVITLRIPSKTLRNVGATLRRHRPVTITVSVTARTAAGEFTPAATSRLVLRR